MNKPERGTALTVFAVLFAILSVSNLLKPFQLGGDQTGFVFLGYRLDAFGSAILGPLFGLFLIAYAYGIWTMRRWVLPLAHFYATWVVLNLILFSFVTESPSTPGKIAFGIVYSIVAIGVSAGAAVILTRRKNELG
jgi:hypothetical protein